MKNTSSKRSILQKLGFGAKIFVAFEVAAFVGSYAVWRKMNHDRDFRFKLYQASPYVLDYFYGIGEKIGGGSTREEDYKAWGVTKD